MKNIGWISVIALLLCIVIAQCEGFRFDMKRSNLNTSILTDSIKYFKNRNGVLTASIGTLQLDKQQLEEIVIEKDSALVAMVAEFAKVKNVVKAKTVTKLPDIDIAFDEPITEQSFDSLGRFERYGAHFGKWYSMGYKVTQDSLHVTDFSTWTDTRIVTGVKRKWFLGKETITTDITFSNPHIEVEELQAAEVVITKQWYEKWYVWLAAGAVGGIIISN